MKRGAVLVAVAVDLGQSGRDRGFAASDSCALNNASPNEQILRAA